ncbi:MAG: thiol:disulfide interchange protein [Hyphomicrobiaceae bacterium]
MAATLVLSPAACARADTEAGIEPSHPAPSQPEAQPAAQDAAQELEWAPYETAELDRALSSGNPTVLTFGAEWCAPCKELKARTFNSPQVVAAAQGFNLLYVDMTEGDRYTKLAQKSFKVRGAPITIFFGTTGAEFTRRAGFIPPDVFERALLDSAAWPGGS